MLVTLSKIIYEVGNKKDYNDIRSSIIRYAVLHFVFERQPVVGFFQI